MVRGEYNRPLADRFWERVNKDGPDGCWIISGKPDANGYVHINLGTPRVNDPTKTQGGLAHRVAWYLHYGVWPTLELDHTCYRTACVNVAHLEEVTRKEHLRRGNEQRRREREAYRMLARLHPDLIPTL